jgi:hypothetical protein
MDGTTRIWNRACDIDFEPSRPGGWALHATIGFHGALMNGGQRFAELEEPFDEAIPDDATLVAAFEQQQAARPRDFGPP